MPQCPQCQAPVQEGQRYCAMCGSPLAAPAAGEGRAPAGKPVQTWLITLLVLAGIVIVFLSVLLFRRPAPPPAPPAAPPRAEAPGPPAVAPATPEEQLKGDLHQLLSTLRETQLQKNLTQLLSCYSADFPNLEPKRQDLEKAWANYDYTTLTYTLDDLKTLDPDHVQARVSWFIDLNNLETGETTSLIQTFQVGFAREGGQWRIASLEEIE